MVNNAMSRRPFVILALVTVTGLAAVFWKGRSSLNIDNLTIVAVSLIAILAMIGLLAAMIVRRRKKGLGMTVTNSNKVQALSPLGRTGVHASAASDPTCAAPAPSPW